MQSKTPTLKDKVRQYEEFLDNISIIRAAAIMRVTEIADEYIQKNS